MPLDEEYLPSEIDLNFEKGSFQKLYSVGEAAGINPERWERVRREIRFEDVVSDLTGHTGDMIRCPFHGRDSRPSFYTRGGFGFCFGCPPKEQYYDQVRFVSRFLEYSRVAALRWLEKKWELPPLADTPAEVEDEEEYTVQLNFTDLQEPYILKAIRQVQEYKDVELAEDFIRYYFEATQQTMWAEEAKKQGEIENAAEMESKAATILARVLGKDELSRVFARKKQQEGK